jgi:dTDP-4-amino-4,6-dideoxygalactose transaminase
MPGSLHRLPPVRRAAAVAPIDSAEGRSRVLERVGPGSLALFESGTAALAAALVDMRERAGRQAAEVAVPAYGCPDLVTACEMAGVQARLVDCRPDAWGFDGPSLDHAFEHGICGLVAVDLLGLPGWDDRLLRRLEEQAVEWVLDSAQAFPFFAAATRWPAPRVVFSFGRGKPLNALGGGALLYPKGVAGDRASTSAPAGPRYETAGPGRIPAFIRAVAFNLLTRPVPYALVESWPRSGLGETRYLAPRPIRHAPDALWGRVGASLRHIEESQPDSLSTWLDRADAWAARGVRMLLPPGSVRHPHAMLRLPVLAATSSQRDTIVGALRSLGVGVTKMYGTALSDVRGVPDYVRRQGPFPGAVEFAGRFFTLPVHGFVTQAVVDAVDRVIMRARS